MRDITSQLKTYQDHLDAAYPAVTAEEVDRDQVEPETRPVRSRIPVLRSGFAFAAAFVLALGVGAIAILLRGGEAVEPVNSMPPTATTPTPAPTTPGSTIPSTETPTPSTPTLQIAGIPAAALVDATWQRRAAIDPDGRPVAVYWSETDGSIKFVRCQDTDCEEPLLTAVLGEAESLIIEGDRIGPHPTDIAFGPEGTPMVLTAGGPNGETYTIYACEDQDCKSVQTSTFSDGGGEPRLAVASDGLARIVYFDSRTQALKLAICRDLACDIGSRSTTTVHDGIHVPMRPSIRIVADGRMFLTYETEPRTDFLQVNFAVCSDDRCSSGPSIATFDDGVGPRVTLTDDATFLAWYRSGPLFISEGEAPNVDTILDAWDLRVARCDTTGCDTATRIDAPWDVLRAWMDPDRLQLLRASTETLSVHSYWSSDDCAELLKTSTVDLESRRIGPESGIYLANSFAASIAPDGAPLLTFWNDQGGLELVEIGTQRLSTAGDSAQTLTTCANT